MNKTEQNRWRTRLAELAGVQLPSIRGESDDPAAADQAYGAMITAAREATRSRKDFHLVFEENRNYGFRRNLRGTRPLGIVVAAAGLGTCVIAALSQADGDIGRVSLGVALAGSACALMIVGWAVVPTGRRVREAAMKYARQLLISSTASAAPPPQPS